MMGVMSSVVIGPVDSDDDLAQILALQRDNREASVSPSEARSQGFVTVVHTLDVLRSMHAFAPSIVARAERDVVVGYALTMTVECRPLLPVLDPLFALIGELGIERCYVMGQVCVARSHRGRGLFDALYAEHRARFSQRFDVLVTEVATRNTRSLRAHERVGFREIKRYRDDTDEWSTIAWRWR